MSDKIPNESIKAVKSAIFLFALKSFAHWFEFLNSKIKRNTPDKM